MMMIMCDLLGSVYVRVFCCVIAKSKLPALTSWSTTMRTTVVQVIRGLEFALLFVVV